MSNERKQESDKVSDAEFLKWSTVATHSANESADETLRDDQSRKNSDERDFTGDSDSKNTLQERSKAEKDTESDS